MGLGSNDCFVAGTPCLNGDHSYSFTGSVGLSRSDWVRLLVYDIMHICPGHRCCITNLSGQRQPYWDWVNILVDHMRQNMTYMYTKYIFA